MDDSGKFSLVDAAVFQLPTNYSLSLGQLSENFDFNTTDGHKTKSKLKKRDGMAYLAPELLEHLKTKDIIHSEASEKL